MGVKLIRSAYSTILREARDGSAGLMDRDGNTVAQAELIPMQLGPIGETLRACLQAPSGRHAEGRRLPHQQRPVRGRPAHPRRLHLHADLRRRAASWASAPRWRTISISAAARPASTSMPPTSTRKACASRPSQLQLRARLERRLVRAPGHRQRARARPHHRRLQRPVRRQRDRRDAGEAALRALRRRQGRSGDDARCRITPSAACAPPSPRRPRAPSTARMRSTTTASPTIRWW